MRESDLAAYLADTQAFCWCCDDCRAIQYARDVRELVAEVRRLRAELSQMQAAHEVEIQDLGWSGGFA